MGDKRIKLLLVESDPAWVRRIGDLLSASPTQFDLIALDLANALERLGLGDIDVVLLDLTGKYSGSHGLGAVNRIYERNPDAPILVLSTTEDARTTMPALSVGAQDCLAKRDLDSPRLVRAILCGIERKRGEANRLRLAAIVESSRDAIVGMSLEGLIVSWNAGAERIFGFTYGEVIGRSISILVPPDCPDEMPVVLEWLKRGEPVKDFEAVRLRKDQQPVHIAASISAIKNTLGKIMGAAMIARDIEERVRAEKERDTLLRQLQATLAQVKTLSGLLPICASCKKIRDDHGYWTQVEVYVRDRSEAEFTHGICPDCATKYRSGLLGKAG